MQILSHVSAGSFTKSLVIIFGLGMIGSATARAALRLGYQHQSDLAFNWRDDSDQARTFDAIKSVCQSKTLPIGKIAIVWSAGATAFHSNLEDADVELKTFVKTTERLDKLLHELCPSAFEFHLLSSAGGLFEGQTVIGPSSKPEPVRPYGRLKLEQERLLTARFKAHQLVFHRPSSVYGPMPPSFRKGLINNLIQNGRAGRVTVLDANVMALRDYIFAQDVGNFIARSIRSGSTVEAKQPERFLVSGRCSSIYEVVRKIERILNLKLRVRYDPNFGNNQNITFSKQVLPPLWKPTSLDIGIRQFLVNPIKQPQ